MNFIPSLSVWDNLMPSEDMKRTGIIVDIAKKRPQNYRSNAKFARLLRGFAPQTPQQGVPLHPTLPKFGRPPLPPSS